MKITYDMKARYGSDKKFSKLGKYDYLLYRQDWDGAESIRFNKRELYKVLDLATIHHNYSILFSKNEKLYSYANDEEGYCKFGCCSLIYKEGK